MHQLLQKIKKKVRMKRKPNASKGDVKKSKAKKGKVKKSKVTKSKAKNRSRKQNICFGNRTD